MASKTSERVAERTRHAKHFDSDTPGQYVAEITSGPQHFRHRTTTEWTDMDQLLVDEGGGDFTILADDADWALQGSWLRISRLNRDNFNVRPDALYLVDTAANIIEKVSDASYAGGYTHTGNQITIHSLFTGVDLEVVFSDDRLTKRWQIAAPLTLPDPSGLGMNPATTVVAFSWDLQTSLPIKDEGGVAITDGWTGAETLMVEGSDAQPLVWWRKPEGWDADGFPISMAYGKFLQGGKRIDLAETVPYQEFVAQTTFPLTLDPTTTIDPGASGNDGTVRYQNNSPFDSYTNDTSMVLGFSYSSPNRFQYRGFHRFDLSSLSGSTCDSATFYGYCYQIVNSSTTPTYTYVIHDSDWSPLDTGDWGAAGTQQGSSWTLNDVTLNDWFTHGLTAGDVEDFFGGWMSTEITQSLTSGTTTRFFRLYTYDNASNKPYLSITYSSAAGFKGFILG